jgi:hypothetical protein
MLSGLFNRKNSRRLPQDQTRQEPSFSDSHAEPATTEKENTSQRVGAHHAGLTITDYARQIQAPTQTVWADIQRGALPARMINGEIFVFPDTNFVAEQPLQGGRAKEPDFDPSAATAEPTHEHELLPPLGDRATRALVHREDGTPITDMTLLLDHLSLAKEENKEILRLTKDSIERITAMTDNLMAMKDEVIKTKEHEISLLNRELNGRDVELKKLRQELEDLQMLAETLLQKKSPR